LFLALLFVALVASLLLCDCYVFVLLLAMLFALLLLRSCYDIALFVALRFCFACCCAF
jgi:hypothetical protein